VEPPGLDALAEPDRHIAHARVSSIDECRELLARGLPVLIALAI